MIRLEETDCEQARTELTKLPFEFAPPALHDCKRSNDRAKRPGIRALFDGQDQLLKRFLGLIFFNVRSSLLSIILPVQSDTPGAFMELKLIAAITLIIADMSVAQAQQPNSPPPVAPPPKSTLAEAQRMVQIISNDRAKVKVYCDISRINYQIAAAQTARNRQRAAQLGEQADEPEKQLGPEYEHLMSGLQQVDPRSKEGRVFLETLQPLEKMCSNK
jgi:hypothetical protein